MKLLKSIVILVLLTIGANALVLATPQDRSSGSNPGLKADGKKSENNGQPANPSSFRPGSGTIIVAELTKGLNAKKATIGERVDAIVTQDLLYQGKIIIPSNAKVVGRVTEVKAASKEDPESHLGVVFEKVILRDGHEMPFQRPAIIEALAPQMKLVRTANQNVTDLPVQMQRGGQATGNSVVHAVGPETRINGGTNTTATGALSGSAREVIGFKGLALSSPNPETIIIVSAKGDVRLDYGTQIVLRVTNQVK